MENGYVVASELLERRKDVTAIFAISDIMAMGVAKASTDMQRRVGEDISIIGFDGMDTAKYYQPSITTVKQPKKKMSELSVKILLELLERKIDNTHIFLDVELIKGESSNKIQ